MKIYIATSWKNEVRAISLARILRRAGFEVDCFCDASTGRYIFHFSEIGLLEEIDAISFLQNARARAAFAEDKKWIDWSDVVVMLAPCGNSAHLEAGYAKGKGKKLYIYGEFPKGEFDVMYGFADGLFRIEELPELIKVLKEEDEKLTEMEIKTPNKYFICELEGTFREVDGEAVTIPGFEDIDTFLCRGGAPFKISEGKTGYHIAAGASKEDAIKSAQGKMEEIKTKVCIDGIIKKTGLSPRYKQE